MIGTLLLLWIGGCLATVPMIFGGRAAAGELPSASDLILSALWPVTMVAFLVDVAKGWRP